MGQAKRIRAALLLLAAIAALWPSGGAARTCCDREIAMMPTAMPPGQEDNLSGFVEGAVIGPLMNQTLGLTSGMEKASCPDIEFYDIEAKIEAEKLNDAIGAAVARQRGWPTPEPATTPPEWDMDYIFIATLAAVRVDGKSERICEEGYDPGTKYCYGGHLEGTFTFTLKLVDHHHDQAVLKEESVSWSGSILYGLGFYCRGGADGSPIRQVVNTFMPLQDIIREYERIPEKATVTLPEGEDEVEAGEVAVIDLSDLLDEKGGQTQPWQRLLVKVEKGKVLNGEKGEYVEEGYHVFRAGKKDKVDIQYLPPPECRRTKETMTVYNACNKKERHEQSDSREMTEPKTELTNKEFDIVCDRWLVTVTYTEKMTHAGGGPAAGPWKGSLSHTQTYKAELRRARKGTPDDVLGRSRFWEATIANLDLENRFQQLTENEDGGKVVAGWLGEKHGPVGARVVLQFNDEPKHAFLTFREVKENPPVWKSTFQWSGFRDIADGACEMSDATGEGVATVGSELFAESGEPWVYKKDQDVLRGERRWREPGSEVIIHPEGRTYASAYCKAHGLPVVFTSEVFYGLAVGTLDEVDKTIKWEVRRPDAR